MSSLLNALDGIVPYSELPHDQLSTQQTFIQRSAKRYLQTSTSGVPPEPVKRRRPFAENIDNHAPAGTTFGSPKSYHGKDGPGTTPVGRAALNTGGFNLNYDNITPISRLDVGGPDQEHKLTEFFSRSIEKIESTLSVKDAMKMLGLESTQDLLPGMEVRLLEHQIVGVAWMHHQERHSQYHGGILADEMGLGKTIQMIAAMVMNLPKPDAERRTTLIVVPAALLQQWKDEIEARTNGVFAIHIHHGKDKLKTLRELKSKDVVITSFQTLNADFNFPRDLDDTERAQWLMVNGGVLARMEWYRVVIDEAQFIRNRATISSQCVAMLMAKYRWLLTGTPVTNTLADIYGLLRFGHFHPFNDWCDFDRWIARVQVENAPLAAQRAQAILKPLLLRRNKYSKREDGQPILDLPPKDVEIMKLSFSKDEQQIYDAIEGKTQIKINKFIKARTLLKNHSFVLVLILRLRQLCCHPHLVLQHTEEDQDPALLRANNKEKELSHAIKTMGAPWVRGVKERFLIRARRLEFLDFDEEDQQLDQVCPVCHDFYMNEGARILACSHELCFDCLLELRRAPPVHDGQFGYGDDKENLRAEKAYETAATKGYRPCPTCKKMMDFTDSKVFQSATFEPSADELANYCRSMRRQGGSKGEFRNDVETHIHKQEAFESSDSDEELPNVQQILAARGKKPVKREKEKGKRKRKNEVDTMPMADNDVIDLTLDDLEECLLSSDHGSSQTFRHDSAGHSKDQVGNVKDENVKPSPAPSVKNEHKGLQPSNDQTPHPATIARWRRGDENMEPSTKLLAVIKLLHEWDATGDKCICYSQWTSMLDLVEILFSRYGIRNLRYDGKMDRAAKESTLATFRKPGGPKVILISTKCGGVGLNLVSANRIINLDLSWNYASESQAYDRVHRLGQDKNVFVKRLVIKNTLEERMLLLQDVKTVLADAALGEGSGSRLHRLSVKDIKFLFGMTKQPSGADETNGGHKQDPQTN